jgi:hypothetical protein
MILRLSSLAYLLLTSTSAFAQNPAILQNSPGCDYATGILQAKCIPIFIGNLIVTIFSVISAFFLINVIYAGYQIAMGSWTGEKSAGKDRLTWSIIGLVVSVCAYLILDLVVSVITP